MTQKMQNPSASLENAEPATITVLMFTPHTQVGGGVVTYTHVLMRHLGPQFVATPFPIGLRPTKFGRIIRPLVPLLDACRLAYILITSRHDIYHINPSMVPRAIIRDGIFLLLLRLFQRRNVLVFIHGWDEQFFQRIRNTPVFHFLFRSTYRNAARILVLASSFARNLELLGLESRHIEVTTTMFDGDALQRASRKREDKQVRILFLSRFVVEKGIFELLSAFKTICQTHTDAMLVMAGDGPEYGRTRHWCNTHKLAERVTFPGYIGGREKTQILLDSDIFVLPSYHGEGCPIALLEAMGAALPVVVTPIGGIPDIVRDGENGFVLQTPDKESIRKALVRLLDDSQLRSSMGEHNRLQSWKNYEAKVVSSSMQTHYLAIQSQFVSG